jgi:hypothetical protein
MSAQPVLRRRLFPIRQERDRPAAFQIADNRPVAMVPPPGEVVDADNGERIDRRPGPTPDDAQQGVVADRGHQPNGKGGGGAPAQREAKMVDYMIQPFCSPGERCQSAIGEPLGEDPTRTEHGVALKAANHDSQFNAPAAQRQVRGGAPISAAHAARSPAAVRAGAIIQLRPSKDDNPVRLDRRRSTTRPAGTRPASR